MRRRTRLWPLLFGMLCFNSCDCDDGTAERTETDACSGDACVPDVGPDLAEDVGSSDGGCTEAHCFECAIGPEGGFCRTEFCEISARPGVFPVLTPLTVEELEAPDTISSQLLGPRMCRVRRPETEPFAPFTLSVRYDEVETPPDFIERELVGVMIDGDEYASSPLAVHDPSDDKFDFATLGELTVGVTARPDRVRVEREFGIEVLDASNPAALLRNLSAYDFNVAFFDGRRFYIGNGPRLLIYENGIPDPPTTPPDVVLGRPDLSTELDFISASSFGANVNGIWSDGTRLVVSDTNRVLLWHQVPTTSFAPADVVLGQVDFSSNLPNQDGEVSRFSMFEANSIASDGDKLIIADTMNNRFLVWQAWPQLTNQPPDFVIGQEDFDLGAPHWLVGALPVYRAQGAYFDGTRTALASSFACTCFYVIDGFPDSMNPPKSYVVGEETTLKQVGPTRFLNPTSLAGFGPNGLALRDAGSQRVNLWFDFPLAGDDGPDLVLGKPDTGLGGTLGRPSASSLAWNSHRGDIFTDDDHVIVADGHRILVWRGLPTTNFEPADLVIGQPGFDTSEGDIDYRGISDRTLAHPAGVAVGGGTIAVADRANSRVVLLDENDLDAAPVLLGQSSSDRFQPNDGWQTPSAGSLNGPGDVFVDTQRLVVADTGNHRVLIWNSVPTSAAQPADVVVGQVAFDAASPNSGAADADGDGDADASDASLHFPDGVWVTGNTLFVADTYNHRVLVFDPIPTSNGASAARVIGQPNFSSNEPNHGLSWFARDERALGRPLDVVTGPGGELYVADAENSRVLVFDPSVDDPAASVVIGQPDFATNVSANHRLSGANKGLAAAQTAPTAQTLRQPSALSVDGGRLYIADAANSRIVVHEIAALPPADASATEVYGQVDATGFERNADGISDRSLSASEGVAVSGGTVFVADTANHRLLRFPPATTIANAVFGQPDFLAGGINGSQPALGILDEPAGIEWDGTSLFVADSGHNRVLRYVDQMEVAVLGQTDFGRELENGGLPVDDWTLARPADVASNGIRLAVADTGNHRVLIWNSIPDGPAVPADVVIGQSDLQSGEPNGGRGFSDPAADTMVAPQGVFFFEDSLYVADSGNNRVLIFDRVPTTHGAAADRILCQANPDENLGNRARPTPGADTCSGPTDVLRVGDTVFVTDALNHRVLGFDAAAATGDSAVRVLGQPGFDSRAPLGPMFLPNESTLNNPTRLAFDGRNLFVDDRGNHRVLIYDAVPTEDSAAANRLIGQVAFDTNIETSNIAGLSAPNGIAVMVRPFHETTLWVSDGGRDRVVRFRGIHSTF